MDQGMTQVSHARRRRMCRTLMAWTMAWMGSAPNASAQSAAFEPNVGQAAQGFAYVVHGGGSSVGIDREGSLWLLTREGALGVSLTGRSGPAEIRGEHPREGRVNVLHGPRSAWVQGAPTFGAVRARQVYPGIDLVHHLEAGRLEYDFEVAPNADPSHIRLRFKGSRRDYVTADGALVHELARGSLVQRRPRAFQRVEGQRREVPVRFRLENGELSFALGRYDSSRALVIDPVVIFHDAFGGNEDETASDVAVSPEGRVALVGGTRSPDLTTVNPLSDELSFAGVEDAWIAFSKPSGARIFTTYVGGWGADRATSVAFDARGEMWVVGTTVSGATEELADPRGAFPLTDDAADRTGSRSGGFLLHFDRSGHLLYSTFLGIDDEHPIVPRELAVTATGGLVMAGEGVMPDATGTTSAAGAPGGGFVAGLTPRGTATWAATVPGTGLRVSALAAQNGVWVGGSAASFTPSAPAYTPTGDESALAFLFTTRDGMDRSVVLGEGEVRGLVAEHDGVYAVTQAASSRFAGAPTDVGGGPWIALSRIDAAASVNATAQVLPRANAPEVRDLIRLPTGALAMTGSAGVSLGFDRAFGEGRGGRDAMYAEFEVVDPETLSTRLTWATLYGGDGDDTGTALALGPDGDVAMAGETSSSTLPDGGETGGGSDVFLLSLGSEELRHARTDVHLGIELGFDSEAACGPVTPFVLRVTNESDLPAEDVQATVEADLPPGVGLFGSWGVEATPTPTGGRLDLRPDHGGSIAPGESWTQDLNLLFDGGGPDAGIRWISVRASATASNGRAPVDTARQVTAPCPDEGDPPPPLNSTCGCQAAGAPSSPVSGFGVLMLSCWLVMRRRTKNAHRACT